MSNRSTSYLIVTNNPSEQKRMSIVGRVGAAHIMLLVLVFILVAGFWFFRNHSVYSGSKLSELKSEKQPSAAGVVFSVEQEPAAKQAEQYYKDQSIRRGR